jgi:hypothetical protein
MVCEKEKKMNKWETIIFKIKWNIGKLFPKWKIFTQKEIMSLMIERCDYQKDLNK